MDKDTAIVLLKIIKKNRAVICKDIEIPLHITANDLIFGLNAAYHLGLQTEDMKECYLRTEYPIALLRGSKKLFEYGVRDGTNILIEQESLE